MPPFIIQYIDHIVLRVADLQRSIDFYRQVFGAEVVKHNEPLGLVHLRAGTSMIDLVDLQGELGQKGGGAAGKERRNVDHFCLRIEPFDLQSGLFRTPEVVAVEERDVVAGRGIDAAIARDGVSASRAPSSRSAAR